MTDIENTPPEARAPRSRWIGLALIGMVLLAAVPIIITWNGSGDEPTGPLTEVPAPAGQPITVTGFGHTVVEGDDMNLFSYGLVLSNQSEFVAQSTHVEFTPVDSAGNPIPGAAWIGTALRLPAGGSTVVAGSLYDYGKPWKITSFADVRATVTDTFRWWRDTGGTDAKLAALRPSEITVTTTEKPGIAAVGFRLPGGSRLEGAEANVLFRDSANTIVGGCSSEAGNADYRDGRVTLPLCVRPDSTRDTATEVQLDPTLLGENLPTPGAS